MKIAHIADLHCCREHTEEALASLRFLAEYIKKSPVSMVALAGDTWDASMLNTEGSGFNRFIDAIREIADLAPVVMIYGTPSHDTDGSLEVFRKLTCRYGITILDPGQAYFLTDLNGKGKIVQEIPGVSGKAVIFGIPEPRKKYLLTETSAGKDETEEAIREAMHRLCYGLAAKRREYADIPCFVLYHGEVAGTVYQNDQTIERGTGIAITIDDLADIKADYYALGHIHKPQKVGNINAYYAGSIYPKNFGETHQAGFKIVDVEPTIENERLVSVDTVDFPHPQNIKIERKWEKGTASKPWVENEVKGKRVWFELTCCKEDRAFINADELLQGLNELGAAPGSRVTISDIPIETVRAASITEVITPARKFEVWAENSNVEIAESHLKKIESLDAEITQGVAMPEGEWELVSLRLKGAIGIMKGIKKEEISVNFDNFSSGLIALTGANGKGKTTLIENCHPYPQLLTRKGKLQDHSSFKDSLREVIYRNRVDGSPRKFLIQIDGQNKSGSCKYFIFKQTAGLTGMEWEPLPGVDGNLKPYEEALGATFGPIELFQRTAFISQRPTKNLPDLIDATAGEKKALFVELAGIDYLQGIADGATEKMKAEVAAVHDADIKARMLQDAIDANGGVQAELAKYESSLTEDKSELERVVEQGQTYKVEADRLWELYEAEKALLEKEEGLRRDGAVLNSEIAALNTDKAAYEEAARNKVAYEAQIDQFESSKKIFEVEQSKRQAVLEKNMAMQAEHTKAMAVHTAKVKAKEAERAALRDKMTTLEIAISRQKRDVEYHERDAAEIKEDCPTCSQKLPPEKIAELEKRRLEFVDKIDALDTRIEKDEAALVQLRARLAGLDTGIAELAFDEPEQPKPEPFDESAMNAARSKALAIDPDEARKNLDASNGAAVRIEGIDRQIADKARRLDELREQIKALRATSGDKPIDQLYSELAKAERGWADARECYTECKSAIARNEALIEAAKKRLDEIAVQEKELAVLTAAITVSKTEAMEWELIAKAFGKDGIQALELDALAPGIAETANRILQSAYGDRFRIEIRTTRIGGAGKKTKQIEDFLIYVIDSEDGEAVLLEDKSGGEAVWIKRAIYDAFAVIRKRNTNFAFLTCFQDETDGSLDSAAKTAYCRMLEASHAESGLRHTIIITHSNEVKAMIEQKIEMEGLAV